MSSASSLVSRLTRTLILWIGGVWLCSLFAVTWWVNGVINRNFDDELVEISHRMLDIAVADFDRQVASSKNGVELIATRPLIADDAVVFHLTDASGTTLLRSVEAPEKGFLTPLAQGFAESGSWRVYTVKHPGRPLFLQLGDPLDERKVAVRQSLTGLFLPLVAVLPLLAFLIAAISRRELKTVQLLEHEIGKRGGSDLSPVALTGLPKELQHVGESVNRMLDRLSHALDSERALAANAAHELRTPLAVVRLRLETALDHGMSREGVEGALSALKSVTHRAEKLLQMSRAESGAALGQEKIDLVSLAGTVIEEFWQAGTDKNRIDLVVAEGVMHAQGDMDTLAIALRNLIENALRHGGDGRVTVFVDSPRTLRVRDCGRKLTEAQRLELSGRLSLEAGSHPGRGLGLRIIANIVERHHAHVDMVSPPTGKDNGLEISIVL